MQNDPKSGVLADYERLVLSSVNKRQAGNYTCFASNVEGDSESNALELRIMCKYSVNFSPIVKDILIKRYTCRTHTLNGC